MFKPFFFVVKDLTLVTSSSQKKFRGRTNSFGYCFKLENKEDLASGLDI